MAYSWTYLTIHRNYRITAYYDVFFIRTEYVVFFHENLTYLTTLDETRFRIRPVSTSTQGPGSLLPGDSMGYYVHKHKIEIRRNEIRRNGRLSAAQ